MRTSNRISLGIKLTAKSFVQCRWALVRLGARCVTRDIKHGARTILDIPGNWCATKLAHLINASDKSLRDHIMTWPEDKSTDPVNVCERRARSEDNWCQHKEDGVLCPTNYEQPELCSHGSQRGHCSVSTWCNMWRTS